MLLVKSSGVDHGRVGRGDVLVFEVVCVDERESSPAVRVVGAEYRSVRSLDGIVETVEALRK